jgi:hypothetical protein
MKTLNETICIRRWQAHIALALSGFAIGTILARITGSLGI